MTNQKPKVFLALSGGIDSAVSAYLLQQAGYDVQAVFMQNWDPMSNHENQHSNHHCQAAKDYEDARAVANFLKIPLIKVNFVAEYWNEVFEPFLANIRTGLIPNPDIACNARIKFNFLLKYLQKRYHFTFFATGHYAQVQHQAQRSYLVRGLDPIKDQTYFLAGIDRHLLPHLLFPLGKMHKSAVRQLAQKLSLPNAKKKESMGICFIGKRDFKTFLQQYLPRNPGPIINFLTNKPVGEHDGAIFYAIGQRKQLNLQTTQKHFVIGKVIAQNIVYVVDEAHRDLLLNDQCLLSEINWFDEHFPPKWTTCFVKLRHCQLPVAARFRFQTQDQIELHLNAPLLAITPGQIAVLYNKNNFVLGSGLIKTILKNHRPVWYIK